MQAVLQRAASIDVAVAVADDGTRTLPADGAKVTPGQPLMLDVVVRNEHVGHRFPGGVLDAQDPWIEVTVTDAHGRRIAEAGTDEERTGADPSAHRLRAVQADEEGTPLLLRETHRFRASVFNHTIAPRDADVVRYRFDAPAALNVRDLPLRVSARLRHRSRDLALARRVCGDATTPRGAAFAREVRQRTGAEMNACAGEPVTEIAATEVWIGAEVPERTNGPAAWRRLVDHGLGLLHALQEDVDAAGPSLERALERVPPGPESGRDRAIALFALAKVGIREGRTEEERCGGSTMRRRSRPIIRPYPTRAVRRSATSGDGRRRQGRCGKLRSHPRSMTCSGLTWGSRTEAPASRATRSPQPRTVCRLHHAMRTCCGCRRWRSNDSALPRTISHAPAKRSPAGVPRMTRRPSRMAVRSSSRGARSNACLCMCTFCEPRGPSAATVGQTSAERH